MLTYAWPLILIVGANILYQICTKCTPESIDPFASLTVTYAISAVTCAVCYFIFNHNGNLLKEYGHVNWATIALGVTLVGLEVGFIYAYKVGWPVSVLSTVQGALLAMALIFVGFILFHEAITMNKVIGICICLVGLYFINK